MIPKNLDENIIYQASILSKLFNEQMQKDFRAAGFKVTTEQFTVLTQLWYRDRQNQQELAEAVGRDKTTISRVINTMITRGLVQRFPSNHDKRYRVIELTEHGAQLQKHLVSISGSLFIETLSGIPEKDLLTTARVLRSLNLSLS